MQDMVRLSSIFKRMLVLGAALALPPMLAAQTQQPQQAKPKAATGASLIHTTSPASGDLGRIPHAANAADFRLPRADNSGRRRRHERSAA